MYNSTTHSLQFQTNLFITISNQFIHSISNYNAYISHTCAIPITTTMQTHTLPHRSTKSGEKYEKDYYDNGNTSGSEHVETSTAPKSCKYNPNAHSIWPMITLPIQPANNC